MPTIVAVDHPILDLVAPISRLDLDKYGLEIDTQTLAGPEHAQLYADLEASSNTAQVPGGAALNSLRAAIWWTQQAGESGACAMVGAVGQDGAAAILREECRKAGIATSFLEVPGQPTARCGILVCQKTRTMVTELGAAACICLAKPGAIEDHLLPHLDDSGRNMVMCTAYYLNKDHDGARRLVSESKGRYELVVSLAATWAAGLPIVAEVMCGCKLVFGTLAEVRNFSKANGGPPSTDDDGVVRFLQAWPGQEDRWAVITDGPGDVRFASAMGIRRFPIAPIERSLIVDDNGAGDASAGAFLACFMAKGSVPEAMDAAMAAARVVLQNVGCQFELPKTEESGADVGCDAGCPDASEEP